MTNKYVISAKRIVGFDGKPLNEEEYIWRYAQDDDVGSYSTGYPYMGRENTAKVFESVEDAKKYFENAKKYLKDDKHDWSTLAIRKRIYKTEEYLKI